MDNDIIRIDMVERQAVTAYVPSGHKLRLKANPALAWLQRQAWRFLERTQGLEEVTHEKTSYTRAVIDRGDVAVKLTAAHAILVQQWQEEGGTLVIGAEDFNDLMGINSPRAFQFQMEYMRRGTLVGRTVRVVPWVRGVVIV